MKKSRKYLKNYHKRMGELLGKLGDKLDPYIEKSYWICKLTTEIYQISNWHYDRCIDILTKEIDRLEIVNNI